MTDCIIDISAIMIGNKDAPLTIICFQKKSVDKNKLKKEII